MRMRMVGFFRGNPFGTFFMKLVLLQISLRDCVVFMHFGWEIHIFFSELCHLCLTHKWLEKHDWVFCTVATDVLVLKHQSISIHSADWTIIALDQFHTEILQLQQTILENDEITFWKKIPCYLRVKVIACHLFSTKPRYMSQCWIVCWTVMETIQLNFNQNRKNNFLSR